MELAGGLLAGHGCLQQWNRHTALLVNCRAERTVQVWLKSRLD